jgi:hypothetical protein
VQSERGSEGERVGAAGLFVPRAKDALLPIRIFREADTSLYRIWFGA